jgi:hypothetical protein
VAGYSGIVMVTVRALIPPARGCRAGTRNGKDGKLARRTAMTDCSDPRKFKVLSPHHYRRHQHDVGAFEPKLSE